MSTSDRRSGSSGNSKKRRNVYISTAPKQGARTGSRERAAAARSDAGTDASATTRPNPARERAAALKADRDSRISSQRRARRLRVAAIAGAVAAVLFACVAGYNSSLFAVTSVEVVGVTHVTADAIRKLAAVPSGATLIRFPADAVATRVSTDPWVASVSVSRVFPSGMRIRVVERVPIAVVDAGASMWLLDGTGAVVATATADTSSTLPVITDVPGLDLKAGRRTASEPLLNAIAVLEGVSTQLAAMVRSVAAPTIDGTALATKDNVEVVIGEAVDLPTKDALARRILSEQKGKVVSIDVRITDRPTWRGLK